MDFAIETRRPMILLCLYVVLISNLQRSALSAPQVPCFFIFGDSLVDNGNNNELDTRAKANYRPYGIDFPQGRPTGRFTNGRNTVDILAELLGFDTYVPPFATARGEDIIKGVNYGSGSAGIRSETGQQLGDRISLDKQLLNHNLTISQIAQLLHGNNITLAKNNLSKCLYYVQIGSNDYINNYYMPQYYSSSRLYTTEQYATVLIQQYSQQLKILYSYGARKISVSGLGAIGCIPAELGTDTSTSTSTGTGIGSSCVESINDAVQLFNDKLKLLVDELNRDLANANFMFTNAMSLVPADLVSLSNGLISKPCCKVLNSTGLCIPDQAPCLIRASRGFFDNFHPTETINQIVAAATYIDIQKLIKQSISIIPLIKILYYCNI